MMSDTTKRPFGTLDIVFGGAAVAALLALVVVRFWVVPSFVAMFRDFGGELPWATQLAIEPGLSATLGALAISVGATGLWRRRTAFLVIAAVLAAIAIVFTIVALYLPVFEVAGAVRAE